MAEVSREVLSEEQKFKSVANDLERTEIKAPAAGQVVSLAGTRIRLMPPGSGSVASAADTAAGTSADTATLATE